MIELPSEPAPAKLAPGSYLILVDVDNAAADPLVTVGTAVALARLGWRREQSPWTEGDTLVFPARTDLPFAPEETASRVAQAMAGIGHRAGVVHFLQLAPSVRLYVVLDTLQIRLHSATRLRAV